MPDTAIKGGGTDGLVDLRAIPDTHNADPGLVKPGGFTLQDHLVFEVLRQRLDILLARLPQFDEVMIVGLPHHPSAIRRLRAASAKEREQNKQATPSDVTPLLHESLLVGFAAVT